MRRLDALRASLDTRSRGHALVRILTSALTALAALTLPAAPAAAQDPASAPDDVSGRWMFVIEAADRTTDTTTTTIAVPVVFEQDGESVTGTVEMPDIQGVRSAEIADGRYVDGTLTFVLRVGAGDQVFTAEVEAEVDGDEMVGEAYVAGLQQRAVFRAQRVG